MLERLHGKSGGETTAGSMQGWGGTYDTLVGLMTLGQEKKIRAAMLELANIQPGERILEVGCGTGSLTLAAKAQAGPEASVCGIDIAPDMIAAAQRKVAKAGAEIQFQVGRIEAIPFSENQFDLVLSSLMLHHVPDPKNKARGMAEIYRVLKPGGRLLIVDMEPPKNRHIRGMAGFFVGREMLAHTVREIIPLLETARFGQIETGLTRYKLLAYLSGKRPGMG